MTVRDILVGLDASEAGEGRLRLAMGLARAHKAHLTAVFALRDAVVPAATIGFGATPAAVGSAGLGAPISPAAQLPAADRAEQAEQRFRTELRLGAVEGGWHLIEDGDKAVLLDLVKASDLAILGQQPGEGRSAGASRLAPGDIVVEAGRPILVVPHVGNFSAIGRRVLVAWDGTREATRALNDALPLIAAADAVTVVHVAAQESALDRIRPALDRIVRHLQRHDVKAQPEQALKGDLAVSDLLLSRAADLDADMIVAGAYHHSQLREALIGGVSRELLRHMTVPVLMSH